MSSLLLSVVIVLVVAAHGAPSPPSPPPTTATTDPIAREFLAAHNKARQGVGVGPLKWSEYLANATTKLVRQQRIKMGCQFAKLTSGKYGMNQFWGSGMNVTPTTAVNHWIEEKKYYDHKKNTCAPNRRCGLYTQVVWRNSLELGCAQTTCVKDQGSLIICFYNPPGNIVGESPY